MLTLTVSVLGTVLFIKKTAVIPVETPETLWKTVPFLVSSLDAIVSGSFFFFWLNFLLHRHLKGAAFCTSTVSPGGKCVFSYRQTEALLLIQGQFAGQ